MFIGLKAFCLNHYYFVLVVYCICNVIIRYAAFHLFARIIELMAMKVQLYMLFHAIDRVKRI